MKNFERKIENIEFREAGGLSLSQRRVTRVLYRQSAHKGTLGQQFGFHDAVGWLKLKLVTVADQQQQDSRPNREPQDGNSLGQESHIK